MSNLLVYTPAPYPMESARGYVLRLSEENGYTKPEDMLRLGKCGCNEERSSRPSTELLQSLVGRTSLELESVSYSISERQQGRKFKLGEHVVHSMHMQTKNTHVCPDCIREQGYINAFYDLRYAIACPLHHKYTVSQCPACGSNLTMSRQGLLMCKCGYDFSKNTSAHVEDNALLGLLGYLWNRISTDENAPRACVESGVPQVDLDRLEVDHLLGIILRLGRGNFVRLDRKIDAKAIISVAALTLEDWPNGLHRYLMSFENDNSNLKSLSFTGQFGQLYNSLFKTNLKKESVAFIKDALEEFSKTEWNKAITNHNVVSGSVRVGDMVGVAGAAKYMGVNPSTVRNLVKEHVVKPVGISEKRGGSLLFKITRDTPRRIEGGVSFSARDAAPVLGLYPGVLLELRRQGYFKVKRLGAKVNSFHELDIDRFKKHVDAALRKAKQMKKPKNNYVSISDVMNIKGGMDRVKAKILGRIINGEIDIYTRDGSLTFDDVVLSKTVLDQCVAHERMAKGGHVTKYQSARMIGCSHYVIGWLIENNYLRSHGESRDLRISVSSLGEFCDRFTACNEVAKKHGISSISIAATCNRLKVDLLKAKYQHDDRIQNFIAHVDIPRVLSLLKA